MILVGAFLSIDDGSESGGEVEEFNDAQVQDIEEELAFEADWDDDDDDGDDDDDDEGADGDEDDDDNFELKEEMQGINARQVTQGQWLFAQIVVSQIVWT
ncbi:Oidioi.mRNA.OKI2018_I69.XSR.g16248.t1.cds [Oikopleura dioica]|uniref:Oidioi.mRNA.OKI2018_I69.XSR.g16248.t1.cds n=1 Tax=Oikopleura dioica TaxID=34765 RepID=A0ABN7SJJ1_OIKDI|nr:Oidioi.mRNA.OKI2018_I69.XSR.g16248.t1.cds [Oikopleura dioica]